MKFRNGIIALGFLTIFLQFLGFPQSWKDGVYIAIGLVLMLLGYIGGRKSGAGESRVETPVAHN